MAGFYFDNLLLSFEPHSLYMMEAFIHPPFIITYYTRSSMKCKLHRHG